MWNPAFLGYTALAGFLLVFTLKRWQEENRCLYCGKTKPWSHEEHCPYAGTGM